MMFGNEMNDLLREQRMTIDQLRRELKETLLPLRADAGAVKMVAKLIRELGEAVEIIREVSKMSSYRGSHLDMNEVYIDIYAKEICEEFIQRLDSGKSDEQDSGYAWGWFTADSERMDKEKRRRDSE